MQYFTTHAANFSLLVLKWYDFFLNVTFNYASQMVLVVKNSRANAGEIRDVSLIPGLGRSLEKEMATHSSILAWRTPWTEEPGGLHSWGCKECDTTEQLTHFHFMIMSFFNKMTLKILWRNFFTLGRTFLDQ